MEINISQNQFEVQRIIWFIKLSSVIQTYLMKHTSFSFVVVVQSLSRIRLFTTPWTTACQVSLSSTISLSLLRFMSIESAILSNHLILCHPLLLLPTIFPSIRVFSKESALCIRWPKYWSFNVNYLQYIKFQNSGWDVAHDACCWKPTTNMRKLCRQGVKEHTNRTYVSPFLIDILMRQ